MKIVVDTNLIISLIFPLPYSEEASRKFQEWIQGNAKLHAPSFWLYEIVSALRKLISTRKITFEKAEADLRDIISIGVQDSTTDINLMISSLVWANKLNQTVAYDSSYFALAERLGAEFWTADQELARSANLHGASWVHAIQKL